MTASQLTKNYYFSITMRRIFATMVDKLLFLIILFFVFKNIVSDFDYYISISRDFMLTFFLFYLIQYIILESLTGYTIGKFILRIKVVDDAGNPPGIIKNLIRTAIRIFEIGTFLSIPALISTLCTKSKQRIGDLATDTYVIYCRDSSDVFYSIEDFNKDSNIKLRGRNSTATKVVSTMVGFLFISFFALIIIVPKMAATHLASLNKPQKLVSAGKDSTICIPKLWSEASSSADTSSNSKMYYNKLAATYMLCTSVEKKGLLENIHLDALDSILDLSSEFKNDKCNIVKNDDIVVSDFEAKQYVIDVSDDALSSIASMTKPNTGASLPNIISNSSSTSAPGILSNSYAKALPIRAYATVIDGDKNFYIIVIACPKLMFEKNKNNFNDIIQTFTEKKAVTKS